MHYYKHNIGDYRRDTMHLTLLEHGIYRQLLDCYYLSEAPIPKETEQVIRRLSIRTEEEASALATILNEFFSLTEEGWLHIRCKREIEAYRAKGKSAKLNGALGGRPRKDKTEVVISGFPELTEAKANALTQELKNSLTHKQSSKPPPQNIPDPPAEKKPTSKAPTKLSMNYQIPDTFRAWAASEPRSVTGEEIIILFQAFRKYWAEKAGQAAYKTDWMEAWQRWVSKRIRVPKARTVRTEKFNPLEYVNQGRP